jgi:AbrB family looped-hinge helix DNA binding protein
MMLVAKKVYTIQDNGQVTLPIEFRKKYNLKKGDVIVFKETDEGLVINPREAQVMKLLDEIGDALKEKGITLEDMIASGEEIRKELIREQYGLDDTDD